MKVIQQFDHNWTLKITVRVLKGCSYCERGTQKSWSKSLGPRVLDALCGLLRLLLSGCSYSRWSPFQANQTKRAIGNYFREEIFKRERERERERERAWKNLILVADFSRLNNIEHSVNRWSKKRFLAFGITAFEIAAFSLTCDLSMRPLAAYRAYEVHHSASFYITYFSFWAFQREFFKPVEERRRF